MKVEDHPFLPIQKLKPTGKGGKNQGKIDISIVHEGKHFFIENKFVNENKFVKKADKHFAQV
jgi:hypothetical protein